MHPDLLRHGIPKSVVPERTASGEVTLRISVEKQQGGTEHVTEFRAPPAAILDLTIRFCLENNIPVPRRANRRIDQMDGKLALVIELDTDLMTGLG